MSKKDFNFLVAGKRQKNVKKVRAIVSDESDEENDDYDSGQTKHSTVVVYEQLDITKISRLLQQNFAALKRSKEKIDEITSILGRDFSNKADHIPQFDLSKVNLNMDGFFPEYGNMNLRVSVNDEW